MADFSTGAELSLTVPGRELSAVRSQIENELSDIPIGVDASVGGGRGQQPRDPSTGRFRSQRGPEQRLLEQIELAEERNELLDDIKDAVEGGIGGDGGGGSATTLGGLARGLGAGVGGGIGLSALGIGAGIGVAGLGVGAGVGAARGEFAQEEFVIETGNIAVDPVLNGPFVENPEFVVDTQLGPENFVIGEDAFQFTAGDIGIGQDAFRFSAGDIDIGANAFRFDPQFGPEDFDLTGVSFDAGDVSVRNDIAFSPSLTISPTINLTGIDLSGLSIELRQEILNSREFRIELDNAVDDAVGDLERRITGVLG